MNLKHTTPTQLAKYMYLFQFHFDMYKPLLNLEHRLQEYKNQKYSDSYGTYVLTLAFEF